MSDEVPPEPNRRLIIALRNSMPTLLAALKRYMAVAEVGHNVGCMKCGQPMHISCSSVPDVIPEFRSTDTPSLLNDKT